MKERRKRTITISLINGHKMLLEAQKILSTITGQNP